MRRPSAVRTAEEQRAMSREYTHKWREANRERARELSRASYARNAEARKAKARRRRADRPEISKALDRKYRDNNPESFRAAQKRYHDAHREELTAKSRQKYSENAEKMRARSVAWYAANRKREAARIRAQKYGLTDEQFRKMKADQGETCAACGLPFASLKREPSVDHDHETGIVRGILCSGCNFAIGHCGDSPERLRGCADFIERTKQAKSA